MEPLDEARAHPRVEATAGEDGDAHEVQRVVDPPEPDVGSVPECDERDVAVAPESHRVHRARVGPGPDIAVERRVAEGTWRAGGPGREEHLPAASSPHVVVDRGVRAPRRAHVEVGRHLVLGRDRKRGEVVDRPDRLGGDAVLVELSPVESHGVVGEANGRRDLRILDRPQLVARGRVQRAAPVAVVVGRLRARRCSSIADSHVARPSSIWVLPVRGRAAP